MAPNTRGLRRASTNVGWMSLNHLAIMVLRLCYIVAAARLLDAEDYGLMAYSQSWYIAVMPLVFLGVTIQFGREIGADRAAGLRFAFATRRTRLLIALAVTLILSVVAMAVEPVPENIAFIIVFALTLAPRAMAAGSQGVLTGLERAQLTFINNLSWRTVELLFAIAALLAGAGIMSLALIHLSSWFLQALNGLILERRAAGPPDTITADSDASPTRRLLHEGLPLALGAFVTGLAGAGTLILFRVLHGAGDTLGAVALFIQASGMLLGFSAAIGNALLPYLARTALPGSGHHATVLRLTMGSSLATGGLATAFLLLTSGPWLTRVLGPGFAELQQWLPGLGLILIPILWHTLGARIFISHAGARPLLPIALFGTSSVLVAALFLIQVLGGAGALTAVILGYLVQGFIVSWAAARVVAANRHHVLAQLFAFLLLAILAGGTTAGIVQTAVAVPAITVIALLAALGPLFELLKAR